MPRTSGNHTGGALPAFHPACAQVWGTERLLPSIPTHPISYGDAGPILGHLGAPCPRLLPGTFAPMCCL